jgi:hypothetical protein
VIFGAFSWDSRGKDLEVFLCGICFGNHTGGWCASFLGDLALKSHRKAFDFGGFRVLRVLEVEA